MKKVYYAFLLFVFFIYHTTAMAEIKIVITEGQNSAKPIAIVPFLWVDAGIPPANVSDIISDDLRNSGLFSPIPVSELPQTPHTLSEFDPQKWTHLGIDAVVIGKLTKIENDKYGVSYQLIDVINEPGTVLSEQQYNVSSRDLRYGVHKVSDQIFEKLTGIKGAFSTRIAYISNTEQKNTRVNELHVSDYDGFNDQMIHRSKQPLMSPAWSADGKSIAYVSFESGHAVLLMRNLMTGKVEVISDSPGHNGSPAFSPDGKKLAFSSSKQGNLNLYVMDLATRKVTQLTSGRSNNTEASWFPDSHQLLYTSDQSGSPQLYTLTLDNLTPMRLTWENQQNQNGIVSSDGQFIFLIVTNNGQQNLSRYDIQRNYYQTLTKTFLDETPSLSPNGAMVIYSSTRGYRQILNLISSDGRFKMELPTNDGNVKFPAWSPYL